jgi:hypothetical protein
MSRDWKGNMGVVLRHKLSEFGNRFKGNLTRINSSFWSVTHVAMSITGVKESNLWLDCLQWVAKAGLLNPISTLLEMIAMSYAFLPFMCFVTIRKIFAVDYSMLTDLSMVTEVIFEHWKFFALGFFAAQYATPLLKICNRLMLMYWLAVLFVTLLPLSICTLLQGKLTAWGFADIISSVMYVLRTLNSLLSVWASATHRECLDKWSTSHMSALAVVASFQPNLYVACLLFSMILLLQMFCWITENTLFDEKTADTKQTAETKLTFAVFGRIWPRFSITSHINLLPNFG